MEEQSQRKHSVTIAGHPTSVTLEPAFWQALRKIASEKGLSINALVSHIDEQRSGNLASALRVYILTYYRGCDTHQFTGY